MASAPRYEPVALAPWADGKFPVDTRTAPEILSLPLYPHMEIDEVAAFCEALEEVL